MAVPGSKMTDLLGSVSSCSKEQNCDPCLTIGQHIKAHRFCMDCQEYLCSDCFECHQRTQSSNDHELVDKNYTDERSVSRISPSECTDKCNVHKTEFIKFFCKHHEVLGCTDCLAMGHRTCDLEYIQDKYEGLGERVESRELDREVKEGENIIQQTIIQKSQVDSSNENATEDIIYIRKKIDDQLDEEQNQAEVLVDERKTTEIQQIQTVHETCTSVSSEIKEVQSGIQDNTAAKQDAQLDITIKRANSKLSSNEIKDGEEVLEESNVSYGLWRSIKNTLLKLDVFGILNSRSADLPGKKTSKLSSNEIKDGEEVVEETNVSYGFWRSIKNTLLKLDVFGILNSRSADLPGKKTSKLSSNEMKDGEEVLEETNVSYGFWRRIKNTLLKLDVFGILNSQTAHLPGKKTSFNEPTLFRYINVRTKSNEFPVSFTGCAVLNKNKVLLADYNNRTLIVVDTESEVIIEKKSLDSDPWDIAVLPQDQIAVTMPFEKEILVMSTAGKLIPIRTIKVKGECYGITYGKDHIYVACNPASVLSMDVQGNNQVNIFQKRERYKNHKDLHYCVLSDDCSSIYLSSYTSHCILRLTIKGEILSIVGYGDLKEPEGMVLLDDGSLMVCIYRKHAIVRISGDLKHRQKVVRVDNPQSICYNRHQQEVYVGTFNSELLLVFSLK